MSRGGACEGDYSVVGQRALSLVDTDSFGWPDIRICRGNDDHIDRGWRPSERLADGFPQEIKGHVDSLSRAINVPNAQANATGVAEVNPVFTWVRLAQRVPVRIHLDVVPEDVRLVQGMTATVQMHPHSSSKKPKP